MTFRRILRTFILMLCLSGTARAQDTIRLQRYAGNLKKVVLRIGGKDWDFLFDTGGGETFISPQVAAHLGKTPHGANSTFRMSGEPVSYADCDSVSIRIGRKTRFHRQTGVWDLMKILPAGLPRVDGVLSLRSFSNEAITLLLDQGLLIVETPASLRRRAARMRPLPVRFATGMNGRELTAFAGIPRNGRLYWLLFDSGNLNDLLLSHATAAAWGLQADTTTQRKQLGALRIDVAGLTAQGTAASEKIIYDGALNFATIRQLAFTFDLRRGRAWAGLVKGR